MRTRIILAAAAAVSAAGLLLAAAPAASASATPSVTKSPQLLCHGFTNGSYCLSPNRGSDALYTNFITTQFNHSSWTYEQKSDGKVNGATFTDEQIDSAFFGLRIWTFPLKADKSRCIGDTNSGGVSIEKCSNGKSRWVQPSGHQFVSIDATNAADDIEYLTGPTGSSGRAAVVPLVMGNDPSQSWLWG